MDKMENSGREIIIEGQSHLSDSTAKVPLLPEKWKPHAVKAV